MSLRKSITVITFLSLLLLIGCSKNQPAPSPPQTPQVTTQTAPTTNPPAATTPTTNPPVTTTQVSDAALYTTNCAGCHGVTGAGGSAGPAINTDEWKNNSSKVQAIILKGQGKMPAFAGKLTDTQIKAIGDFVASLKK
ncbi:cytochrome c [Desulfosporosinus sp. Sb-LF]|uniref:c-type cytochrome n=1 Tax=Desulfosporosinus sp. Sb-LF TaxID=2560027 RepID=UPI00107F68D9|nr:cytochrome c [Desulfosporosinus sp. Sb-LF]TGE31065.1 cytochrome c [Desulfosporosinus sp. Sb-LF]